MRFLHSLALVSAVSLTFWGCGSDQSTSSSSTQDPRFAIVTGGKDGAKPKIEPSKMSPPKKPLMRDIEVGSGPAAKYGDEVGVYFLGINYRSGKQQYQEWPPPERPYTFVIGRGSLGEAWEKGIEGMKVGGRREMIIPSRLLYGTGTVDYVVDPSA